MVNEEKNMLYYWGPFLALGIFISMLVLWVSPFNLKWISVAWFFFIFGSLSVFKAGLKAIERTMWVLAGFTFIFENALFIWLENVI